MEISVNTFVSLDGVMQGPGGYEEDRSGGFEGGGWGVPLFDEDTGAVVDTWFAKAEAILLGRTTFDMMRPYWSSVTDPDNKVATILNTWPKYLVSNTLSDADADWGDTTVVRGDDVVQQIQALKDKPGHELQVHGSWQLARALHDAGLVDIYRLIQFPVVVGSGKRLFADGAAPATFELTSSSVTGSGSISLELRRKDNAVEIGEFIVVDGVETVGP